MDGRFAKLYVGTEAELALEPAVASLGLPYRTQFPLHKFRGRMNYFPDIVIPPLRLVIEVDGREHKYKKEEDAARAAEMLALHGWRTYRCSNEDAMTRPYEVVNEILASIPGLEHMRAEFNPKTAIERWGLPLPAEPGSKKWKSGKPKKSRRQPGRHSDRVQSGRSAKRRGGRSSP